MNAILLNIAVCLCGMDNIYITSPIHILEIIDGYNLVGTAAIIGEDQLCWFKIDTQPYADFKDIVLKFPYTILEGSKEYRGNLIKVFHSPSQDEKIYILKVNKKNRDLEKRKRRMYGHAARHF